MNLYLVRHGQARPGQPDAARTLTSEGEAEVARVAARLVALGVSLAQVYHSGYTRAEQTAGILARALGIADRVAAREGLAPNDPPEPVARWLLDPVVREGPGGLALVGHLPFLDHLAAQLLGVGVSPLVFEPGAVAKLVPRAAGETYAVAWLLPPALA